MALPAHQAEQLLSRIRSHTVEMGLGFLDERIAELASERDLSGDPKAFLTFYVKTLLQYMQEHTNEATRTHLLRLGELLGKRRAVRAVLEVPEGVLPEGKREVPLERALRSAKSVEAFKESMHSILQLVNTQG